MLPETFDTARLILRPLTPADAGPIFDTYARDAEVTRFVIWRPHQSRCDTEAFIDLCVATPADVARTYVLADRQDRALRGIFGLRQTAPYRLDFGYVLARPWWGQGLMTEALTDVVHWPCASPQSSASVPCATWITSARRA
jgi:RimJ/RimL family protein N-acetyltransferase